MVALSKRRSVVHRKIFGYMDVSFDDEFVKFSSHKETIIVPLCNVFNVAAAGSGCWITHCDYNNLKDEGLKTVSFKIENNLFGEALIKFKNAVNMAKGLGPY
jgi:hypothetical protein